MTSSSSSINTGFDLEARTTTPIAQLGPSLPDPSSRAVSGIVTLVWPYNSVTNTLAFTLAEPDVRLRRAKGQVRVQLQGSSATAVSSLKLGGGDTVTLGLDSVQWVKDSATVQVPASRLEWQLQYAEKLMLQATVGASREVKRVTVDHPFPIPTPPEIENGPRPATLNQEQFDTPARVSAIPSIPEPEVTEYASPAFLKRARLSYGSLFEGGMDIFDEDGGAKGKGRKRTKYGRNSNMWRYTSQSPSPSPEPIPETPSKTVEVDVGVDMDMQQISPPKPQMADEGCQTMEVDMSPMPAGRPVREEPPNRASSQATPHQPQSSPPPSDHSKQPASLPSPPSIHIQPDQNTSKPSPPAVAPTPTQPPIQRPSAPSTPAPNTPRHNTLFGNYASTQTYDTPRFGNPLPRQVDGGFSMADQVRFGFSHVPQTNHQTQPKSQTMVLGPEPTPKAVPEAMSELEPEVELVKSRLSHLAGPLLEPTEPSKYSEMETYVGPAEQEMEEESSNPFAMAAAAPAVETFGDNGQWAMATEVPSYNSVEGGHYGTDALEEGTRITIGEPTIRSDEIDVDKVPPGFASYGIGHENEIASEPDQSEEEVDQGYIPGENFVENDELQDDLDDEVAVEDNDHQEYNSEGEILEGGDYDQRVYNEPETDDEGLEDERSMVEDEVYARDNYPDAIDEDEMRNMDADESDDSNISEDDDIVEDVAGDSEHDDEVSDGDVDARFEEEGFDEIEEEESSQESGGSYDEDSDWESRGRSRLRSPTPPKAGPVPVVISLLSESEDSDDEGPESLGADFGTPEPISSIPSQHTTNRDLKIRYGDIDPNLLRAVAPDQDKAAERAAEEAEEKALEAEMEADLDDAFELVQHEDCDQELEVAEDNSLSLSASKEIDLNARNDNQRVSSVADDKYDHTNNNMVDKALESAISSGDGAGSSPPKKAHPVAGFEGIAHEDSASVGYFSKPKTIDVSQDMGASIEHGLSDHLEQQVTSPLRPSSAAVANKAENTIGTVEPVTPEDVVMEDPANLMHLEDTMTGSQEAHEQLNAGMELGPFSPQPEQEDRNRVGPNIAKSTHPNGGISAIVPSSPLLTQSFGIRGQPSLIPDEGGNDGDLPPTPMGTQPSEMFICQADLLSSSSQVEIQNHVQEEADVSYADMDMGDAADEAEAQSMDDLEDSEDEGDDDTMDINTQIEAQLRVEVTRTTVVRDIEVENTSLATQETTEPAEDNNTINIESAYYSAPGEDDQAAERHRSSEAVIQNDPTSQEIKEAMQKDMGGLMHRDLEQNPEGDSEDNTIENKEAPVEEAIPEDKGRLTDKDDSHHGSLRKGSNELVVEISVKAHVEKEIGFGDSAEEQNVDHATEDLGEEVTEAPEANVEVNSESGLEPDGIGEEGGTEEKGPEMPLASVEGVWDTPESHTSQPQTRSQKGQELQAAEPEPELELDTASKETSPAASKTPKAPPSSKRSRASRARPKERADPSIELARATLNKRSRSRRRHNHPESPRHWHHTRQHSPPGECSLSPVVDEIIRQDSSVALARAALQSPSRRVSESFTASHDPHQDLTKRLRTTMSEYTPLKIVRISKSRPDHFHVLAIAVTASGEPQRTKNREFIMTIGVIDPSVSPQYVVDVQFSAAHKAYLPSGIKPGQGVMLNKFQTLALAGKETFGLKATEESTWAVFTDDDGEKVPDVMPVGSEGTAVEEVVTEYMRDLRAWYADLNDVALEKVAKACGNAGVRQPDPV